MSNIIYLIKILESKNLLIEIIEHSEIAAILSFNVVVKPGSSVEKAYISNKGVLVIQTRSQPVDGKANLAVAEAISKLLGISKSFIEIIRGEKSKSKRVKLLLEFTSSKKMPYYAQKFSEILIQAV